MEKDGTPGNPSALVSACAPEQNQSPEKGGEGPRPRVSPRIDVPGPARTHVERQTDTASDHVHQVLEPR